MVLPLLLLLVIIIMWQNENNPVLYVREESSGMLSNLTKVTQPAGNTAGLESRSSASESVFLILIQHECDLRRSHRIDF